MVRGTYGTSEADPRTAYVEYCPEPSVRTARRRLVRVARTYSSEARGRVNTGRRMEGWLDPSEKM